VFVAAIAPAAIPNMAALATVPELDVSVYVADISLSIAPFTPHAL